MWCSFDVQAKGIEIQRLEHELQSKDFWQDSKLAKQKQKEISKIKKDLEIYDSLKNILADIEAGIMLVNECYDSSLEKEIMSGITDLSLRMDELELVRMFSGPYDSYGAIVTIQSGAGGTESQDWARILLRMYTRWAERKSFKVQMTDLQPGEVAGIKTVTLRIEGSSVYGLLRSEKGVHRFMRISPFDTNKRRQTSFARVDLLPILEDDEEIKIEKSEIEMTFFRSSGSGGQNVNKLSTACRIRHIPSGIVVKCQASRYQGENKESALAELRNRLVYKASIESKKRIDDLAGEKDNVSFGYQIRTYIVHSRQVVIDERNGKEYRPVEDILDGDLDGLMSDYLKEASCQEEQKSMLA